MGETREVIVEGTPVSVNSHGANYNRWKEKVRETAYDAISEDDKLGSLEFPLVALQLFYFAQDESQLDLDNIAKAILDGITGPLLSDDSQIVGLCMRRVALRSFVATQEHPAALRSAVMVAATNQSEFILIRAKPDDWDGVFQ
ncbi:MAG: RusA family crossover junction endodeoxyribonuclease [Polyangiales bacterium]